MKNSTRALFALIAITLSSCFEMQDSGPMQEQAKEFTVTDFNRLEISNDFDVTIVQGNSYSIKANGDRRNIDDLILRRYDNTLRIKYDNDGHAENRQYKTYLSITMPSLNGVLLSGAAVTRISGATKDFDATLSGASELMAFDFETETVTIEVSGASHAEVFATQRLKANASGASKVRYRGNPAVDATTSGASSISAD